MPDIVQELTPDTAIAAVLGFHPNGNAHDLLAALNRSFRVNIDSLTGKREVTFVPSGPLSRGALSTAKLVGARESLFARTETMIEFMKPIAARLEPVAVSPDRVLIESIRALIPGTLDEILAQMSDAEVFITPQIDALLASATMQIDAFGDALGIDTAPVHTMAEEAIRSDFQTLRDSSATLLAMRQSFTSDVGLTTTIAAVEDTMEALGNASDALRQELLDAGFAPIDLRNGSVSSGDVKLNLAEFLAWTTGAPGQAFAAIRSGESSGLELSVKPAVAELKAFLDKGILSLPSTGCEQHFESKPIDTAFCLIKEHVNAASDAIAALPRPRMCPPPSAPYQPKVPIRPPSKTKSEA